MKSGNSNFSRLVILSFGLTLGMLSNSCGPMDPPQLSTSPLKSGIARFGLDQYPDGEMEFRDNTFFLWKKDLTATEVANVSKNRALIEGYQEEIRQTIIKTKELSSKRDTFNGTEEEEEQYEEYLGATQRRDSALNRVKALSSQIDTESKKPTPDVAKIAQWEAQKVDWQKKADSQQPMIDKYVSIATKLEKNKEEQRKIDEEIAPLEEKNSSLFTQLAVPLNAIASSVDYFQKKDEFSVKIDLNKKDVTLSTISVQNLITENQRADYSTKNGSIGDITYTGRGGQLSFKIFTTGPAEYYQVDLVRINTDRDPKLEGVFFGGNVTRVRGAKDRRYGVIKLGQQVSSEPIAAQVEKNEE